MFGLYDGRSYLLGSLISLEWNDEGICKVSHGQIPYLIVH